MKTNGFELMNEVSKKMKTHASLKIGETYETTIGSAKILDIRTSYSFKLTKKWWTLNSYTAVPYMTTVVDLQINNRNPTQGTYTQMGIDFNEFLNTLGSYAKFKATLEECAKDKVIQLK